MEINEFLRLLQEALKNDGVKKEILKIVNETDNNFVSKSETNEIGINENDDFFSQGMLLMQKGYDKLNIKISNLQNELNEKIKNIKELEKDLENSKQEIEKKDKNILELKDDKKESQKKIEELKEKNNKLNDKVKTKDNEIKYLNNNISNLTNDLTELENENDNLNSKLVKYKNNCKKEIEIYEKFLSLSDETKGSLERTFKGNSLSDFISCGVQNIDNFWEYIKSEILENENDDIEKLVEIFYFLFEKYRVSEDKFELLDTKESDDFDTNLEIKHNESPKNSGIITKIYLKGYKNNNKDKIIKQSIVKVG